MHSFVHFKVISQIVIVCDQLISCESRLVPSTLVKLREKAASNNQNFRRHACGNKIRSRHKVFRHTPMIMFHAKTIGPCRTQSSYRLLLPSTNFCSGSVSRVSLCAGLLGCTYINWQHAATIQATHPIFVCEKLVCPHLEIRGLCMTRDVAENVVQFAAAIN